MRIDKAKNTEKKQMIVTTEPNQKMQQLVQGNGVVFYCSCVKRNA